MATQSESSHDPEVVGRAFAEQFYTILHEQPTHAFKFYQDSSVLSRPGPDGVMKSVTGVKEINDLILSLDFKSYRAQIIFADPQLSFAKGVIVLVTGYLIGADNVRRKFTQSFFLAPQESGYYVSNDVFRYVDDIEPEPVAVANNDVDESTQAALSPDPELTDEPENAVANNNTAPLANGDANGEEVSHSSDNRKDAVVENGVVAENVVPSSEIVQKDSLPVSEISTPIISEDAPKKTYLSVVHALSKNSSPFVLRPPAPKPKAIEQPRRVAAPEASAPKSNKALERNNSFSGGGNGGRQGRGGHRDENGYRNDNAKGRGNLNGGRNSGRNEKNESSGQTRGNGGRNEDSNKKVHQNGGPKVTREDQN
ncbi:Nuclear transport factor 2 [Corchorus olitorius]|uniref:Nuclear transport factor 2 n=1 Tax=Corchorus olitorius TaxID=93759 RepID=A0A1R3HNX0_9ROSI|nr:Nuclear transport factor 2 [Corchorus olitorius]